MARKTDIRLRRSATAGNAPSTSDLNLGELALNTYDGAIFLKTHDGSSDAIAVAADARTLSIDYTNQRVGIGDTSPDNKLYINSGADNINTKFESTDTEVRLLLKDSTGTAYIAARNDIRFGNDTSASTSTIGDNYTETAAVGITFSINIATANTMKLQYNDADNKICKFKYTYQLWNSN